MTLNEIKEDRNNLSSTRLRQMDCKRLIYCGLHRYPRRIAKHRVPDTHLSPGSLSRIHRLHCAPSTVLLLRAQYNTHNAPAKRALYCRVARMLLPFSGEHHHLHLLLLLLSSPLLFSPNRRPRSWRSRLLPFRASLFLLLAAHHAHTHTHYSRCVTLHYIALRYVAYTCHAGARVAPLHLRSELRSLRVACHENFVGIPFVAANYRRDVPQGRS